MWRIRILSDVGVREGGVGSRMQGGCDMLDLYRGLIMKLRPQGPFQLLVYLVFYLVH